MVALLVFAALVLLFVAGVWKVTSGPPNEDPDLRLTGITGTGGADFEDDPWRGVADPSPEDVARAAADADAEE